MSAGMSPGMSPGDLQQLRFGELTIGFDHQVLRPREWTTAQSRWAADLLSTSPEGPVLELCAGVGQIGLLAVWKQPRELVMVDANARACELARRNADEAGLSGVEVRHGRLEESLGPDEWFVGVIADPPWVPRDSVDRYPEDPTSAIDGGPEGLDVALACIEVAARHLVAGGWLLLQLGTRDQAGKLAAAAARHDLKRVELREYDRGVVLQLTRQPD
jgi:release factor glutamine methyltransferase